MGAEPENHEESPIRPRNLVPLGLTLRQAEVLSWLAFGKTGAEIGAILGIAVRTVSHTASRVYHKLGVGSRVQAASRTFRATVRSR
jgi:DNA-binding CsgD family transcriptional regulator